jgi:hypothetical protein
MSSCSRANLSLSLSLSLAMYGREGTQVKVLPQIKAMCQS